MKTITIDIETYPCLFLVKAKTDDGEFHTYKAKAWIDTWTIRQFLTYIKSFDWVVTYNGASFDLRVLAWLATCNHPWISTQLCAEEASKLIEDQNQKGKGFKCTSKMWSVPWETMRSLRNNHFDVYRCFTVDKTKSLKHWELYNGWSVMESDVAFDAKSMTSEEEAGCELYCEHDVDATKKLFLKPECQELLEVREWIASHCNPRPLPDLRPPDLSEVYCYGDVHVDEVGTCYEKIPWDEFDHLPEDFLNQMKMLARHGIDGFEWNGITYGKGGAHYVKKGFHKDTHIYDVASMYPHIVWHYVPLKTAEATKKYVGALLERLELKKLKRKDKAKYSKAKDLGLKLVLNSITGKFRQEGALAYAPESGLAMCIIGQLIITDALLASIQGDFDNLVEVNTDSFAVDGEDNIKRATEYCSNVQHHMTFEEDVFPQSYWKDVNNYVVFNEDGSFKETHGQDSSDIVKKGNEPVVARSLFSNLLLPKGGTPVLKKAQFYKDYVVKYSKPASARNATIDGKPMTKKHYYFLWVTDDCPDAHEIQFASERIDKSNGLIKNRRGVYAFDTETIAKYFKYIDKQQYVMDLKALLVVWNRPDLCQDYSKELSRKRVIARNKALKEAKSLKEILEVMSNIYTFQEPSLGL